jgi:DNA-binding MarR family transcriptional regulator
MGAHTSTKPRRSDPAGKDIRSVFDSIRRIVRALRVSSRAAEKRVGLSGAQLFVLHNLSDGGRALSLNELAERTMTDQSSVSVVVQRLVKRGLVMVARSRADGRRIELALTASGRRAIGKSAGAAQDRLIESLKLMAPGQRRQLALLLDQLVHQAGIAGAAPSLFFEHEERDGDRKTIGKDSVRGTSR